MDPLKCIACELDYRRHDIFAVQVNRDENAPLPGIMMSCREMKDGDTGIIDIIFEPVNRVFWEYDAGRAYEKFQNGRMPRKLTITPRAVMGGGAGIINFTLSEIQTMLLNVMGGSGDKLVRILDPERESLAVKGLTNTTTHKIHNDVLKCGIRIICQSEDRRRAALILRSLSGAYKDITADNELIYREKNPRKVVNDVLKHRLPSITIKVSTAEAGKLMQLPTGGLQEEFPQICSIKQREVNSPEELFLDAPGIIIGEVTEKGLKRIARVPVAEIPGVKLKHVYDALCTPTMGTGQMGSGKTEGLGTNWVHGFIKNGLSAFVIDTADGQLARVLEDSLPPDYPDKKIIHLEIDETNYPIALNWGDTACRRLTGKDNDLEALMMGERLTTRLIDYLDGTNQTELTERMRRYLTSVARAVLRDPNKSLLDIELALRSPVYREELLKSPGIKEQPEIVHDLESLQNKAATGTDSSIIDPILARLKMFSETTTLQNLFYQSNKLDKTGRPILDFRKYADNTEGGYGYLVCIHASSDAWGEDGQELVLSFLQDKILMAIYSRVDVPQDLRKPCLNLIDEPHRFINKAARLYKNASVELRKYRMKLFWLAHHMSQMGKAAEAVSSGGCQFIQYKTQNIKQFSELAHAFAPFEPEELYKTLPEKWYAVNKVRLPSGQDCPAFIAKMAPPPPFIRSREKRREECAKQFGRPWREVNKYIQDKRLKYQQLDEEWRIEKKEERKKVK